MKPYYDHAGITIYHADALDVLPTLEAGSVDLVLTDPPYGMNYDTDNSRFSGGTQKRGLQKDWGAIVRGDDAEFDPAPLLRFKNVIAWGYNHWAQRVPVGTTLVWVKKHERLFGTWLSDAEIGWMNSGYGVYVFKKSFPPPAKIKESTGGLGFHGEKADHPTQKPIALMQWCIAMGKCPEGGMVLDPFMGSGTTLRAAKDLGRRAIGIEIEERYCEIAARRLSQEVFAL